MRLPHGAISVRSGNACGYGSIPLRRSRARAQAVVADSTRSTLVVGEVELPWLSSAIAPEPAAVRRRGRTGRAWSVRGAAGRGAPAQPAIESPAEGARRSAASILVTLSFFFGPRGVSTVTTSFRLAPIRALPIGDSLESFCSAGLASVAPTSWNFCDLPDFWSLTWTIAPTVDLVGVEVLLVDHGRASQPSWSWAMRCSSIACSFLASSYSAFSEMSPNSRASLMRSATSRRLSVSRWASSALSFSSPSWVISVSRNLYLFLAWRNGPLVTGEK